MKLLLPRQRKMHRILWIALLASAVLLWPKFSRSVFANAPIWSGFAGDAEHTAQSSIASQTLTRIHWQAAVDLTPQYSGNELLIHYGSPMVTAANTVIVPVKTGLPGSNSGFRVDAHAGATGNVLWSLISDYVLPSHNWVPEFGPALTYTGRVYVPGAGGTVLYRDSADIATGMQGRLAFYGINNYNSNPTKYQALRINTPITVDASGNIYFGFVASGKIPGNLKSGIARIDSTGNGSWVSVATAAGDQTMTKVVHNCAPAVSADGSTVYVAVSNGKSTAAGYLLALNAANLSAKAKVRLKDPKSGQNAWLPDDGTASPTIGPDGDVYYGVLENPFPENNDRGWMLHFNSTLTQSKTPGSFGWDDTASIVPASLVQGYGGTSQYLLMTKYNNYKGVGTGDGHNEIAILDPNATQPDPTTGVTVMKEVMTALGPTLDTSVGGVKEWCINSAVVDVVNKVVIAGSEDGKLYRWDLTTGGLTEVITLTSGLGEAYTPTLIGADGTVYAINNAILFAIGS